MKEEKEYKLNTIQDILNVITKDNIENFKKDFNKWLDYHLAIKMANELFKNDIEVQQVHEGTMIWIDDNKNDANINVEFNLNN